MAGRRLLGGGGLSTNELLSIALWWDAAPKDKLPRKRIVQTFGKFPLSEIRLFSPPISFSQNSSTSPEARRLSAERIRDS